MGLALVSSRSLPSTDSKQVYTFTRSRQTCWLLVYTCIHVFVKISIVGTIEILDAHYFINVSYELSIIRLHLAFLLKMCLPHKLNNIVTVLL